MKKQPRTFDLAAALWALDEALNHLEAAVEFNDTSHAERVRRAEVARRCLDRIWNRQPLLTAKVKARRLARMQRVAREAA